MRRCASSLLSQRAEIAFELGLLCHTEPTFRARRDGFQISAAVEPCQGENINFALKLIELRSVSSLNVSRHDVALLDPQRGQAFFNIRAVCLHFALKALPEIPLGSLLYDGGSDTNGATEWWKLITKRATAAFLIKSPFGRNYFN